MQLYTPLYNAHAPHSYPRVFLLNVATRRGLYSNLSVGTLHFTLETSQSSKGMSIGLSTGHKNTKNDSLDGFNRSG